MRPLLRALQAVVASSGAFAALTAQGTVVTWGDAEAGGDSSTVQVPGTRGDGDRLGATWKVAGKIGG